MPKYIYLESASGCWRVRHPLLNKERRFKWKDYGNKDNAYKEAEKWRDEQLEKYISTIPTNTPSSPLYKEQEEEKISAEQQRTANMIMNLVDIFVPPDENTERYQQEAKNVNKGREGYIYCLYNPAHPLIYKIGLTRRTVEDRLNELNKATSLCHNFVVIISKKVTDCIASENKIHNELKPYRINKEFFQAPLDKIQNLFDLEG